MFETAKKISFPKSASKAKGPAKPVDQVIGWEELAALDATSKALASLVELRKGAAREVLIPVLIERGCALQAKPPSMSPVEGEAVGSAYVAKRTALSVVTDEEAEMIAELAGVPVGEDGSVEGYVEVVESQPSLLAVNPAYAGDDELLRRIGKALSGIKGIPEDFIVQTEPVAKRVVSDTALGNLFRLSSDKVGSLFPLVAGVSLRPVFGGTLEKAWSIIKPLIPEAVTALESAPKNKKRKAA